jgi:hypothetical protein
MLMIPGEPFATNAIVTSAAWLTTPLGDRALVPRPSGRDSWLSESHQNGPRAPRATPLVSRDLATDVAELICRLRHGPSTAGTKRGFDSRRLHRRKSIRTALRTGGRFFYESKGRLCQLHGMVSSL